MPSALWLKKDESLSVKEIEDTVLEESDKEHSLVRVTYSGVNPADIKHASLGIYDCIAGYDFSGVVEKTAPGSPFKVGDVVAGMTPTGRGRAHYYGTHQNYILITNDPNTFKIPSNVPVEDAACFAVTMRTAADALFNMLDFPLPDEAGKEDLSSTPLLIWGASSNVGTNALQFAKAMGISPVFATASAKNHDFLKELGATECFDYKDKDVVKKIREAVDRHGQPLMRVLDAVGGNSEVCAECAHKDAKGVSTTGGPKYPSPFAIHDFDCEVEIPKMGVKKIPAQPEKAARVYKAVDWVLERYGKEFKIPNVQVFDGTVSEVRDKIQDVADGKTGMGKIVIKHPIHK